ncbi:hypothetical protein [Castellaniella sp.]|uniref:hypothetical protein n=1 Tax=Castellaniella sp. TaxID=1955812 RepID=UPI002AFE0378|nr:hypothetical protein [Castellaniella sp.]
MKRIAEHPDAAVIERLDGTVAVARLCKISAASVSRWKKKGIPQAREMYLRLLRPDVFQSPSDRSSASDSQPSGK